MKKILLIACLCMLWASQSFAAWTVTVTPVTTTYYKQGPYFKWKIVCVSDGSTLTAAEDSESELVAKMDTRTKELVRGAAHMVMDVEPGIGGVAPNGTMNISFVDNEGQIVFATTGVSNVANTAGFDLAEDYGPYWTVFTSLYLVLNDIGDAGDTVTLYITSWNTEE